ncbi:MAG: circadian clock-controlled protein [Bacillota bacterium]|nr:circadian clock-controlled protein [Bacillota bacterium]
MAKKISISFKETLKDIALYNAITSLDDKSHDIKQILYPILVEGSKPNTVSNNNIHKEASQKIDLGILEGI